MKTNPNDPASPIADNYFEGRLVIGLTKREHIATQALIGFINTGRVRNQTLWSKILILFGYSKNKNAVVNHDYNYVALCVSAVEVADLLIEELNKK